MNLPTQSIRWRIQAWHTLLLVCIVSALVIGFYQYERHSRVAAIDAKLLEALPRVLPVLAHPGRRDRDLPPPDDRRHPPGPRDLNNEPDFLPPPGRGGDRPQMDREEELKRLEDGGFYFAAWTREGDILRTSASATPSFQDVLQDNSSNRSIRSRGGNREIVHLVPNGVYVLLGTSMEPMRTALNRLALWLIAAGCGVVAIGSVGGWWMAGRAIRPIQDISGTAETIASGDFSKRIAVSTSQSELNELAKVLNHTFDRLEDSFDQQVRFTADASHELRTPIAVMLTQIQLALSRERTPAEYQQTLQTCERAAERMRALVSQLLDLARVDSGEFELQREDCDVGRIAREAMEFIQPLAEQKQIKLTSSIDVVRGRVDAMKMGQVLINLLNNAVTHNPNGIEICLTVKGKGDKVILRVSDNGEGIPSDALPHLFERFYRVDKSRARTKGNSGLGLAICKAIIEAHRGKISVESALGHGTTFQIELPLDAMSTSKTWTRLTFPKK